MHKQLFLKNKNVKCPNCENPYDPALETCPHCHKAPEIDLDIDDENTLQETVKELKSKLKKNPGDKLLRDELSSLLYSQGMKYRYDKPAPSLDYFKECVKVDPDHLEARMKVSWLCIKFSKYLEVQEILKPLVESKETTLLQKQRAYTNLSCAANWAEIPKWDDAEKYAREGIALDGEGTAKLWENLATALRNQERLQEAHEAFRQALKLNPKSINAIERQASIERHLKVQKKKTTTTHKKWKIKSPREFLKGTKSPRGTPDFEKL